MAGAEQAVYSARHDGPRQSLLPIHLFAKGGLVAGATVLPAEARPLEKALAERLASDLAPVRRFIDGAPGFSAACLLQKKYEIFLQYGFARDLRDQLPAELADGSLRRLGLARIAAAPLAYAEDVARYVGCLWTLGLMNTGEKTAFRSYTGPDVSIPYAAENPGMTTISDPWPAAGYIKLALTAFSLLTGVAALAGLWLAVRASAVSPAVTGCCLIALFLHGTMILIALTAVPEPRYVFVLWPAMIGFCGLFAALLVAGARALVSGRDDLRRGEQP